MPMAASCGQMGFMYSRLDEEELCSSPPEDQERLAVDDELRGSAAFLQMRGLGFVDCAEMWDARDWQGRK